MEEALDWRLGGGGGYFSDYYAYIIRDENLSNNLLLGNVLYSNPPGKPDLIFYYNNYFLSVSYAR